MQPRPAPAGPAPKPPHPATLVRGTYTGEAIQPAALVTEAAITQAYADLNYAGNKLSASAKTASIARRLNVDTPAGRATILPIVKALDGTAKKEAKAVAKAHPAREAAEALAARTKDIPKDEHPAFAGVHHTMTGTVKSATSSALTEAKAAAGFVAFMNAKVEDEVGGRSKWSCAEPAAFNSLLVALQGAGTAIATVANVEAIVEKSLFYSVNKNGSHKEPCENCNQWVKQEPN